MVKKKDVEVQTGGIDFQDELEKASEFEQVSIVLHKNKSSILIRQGNAEHRLVVNNMGAEPTILTNSIRIK